MLSPVLGLSLGLLGFSGVCGVSGFSGSSGTSVFSLKDVYKRQKVSQSLKEIKITAGS